MTKGQKIFMWCHIILLVLCLHLQFPIRYASYELFHRDLFWIIPLLSAIVWAIFIYIIDEPWIFKADKGYQREVLFVSLLAGAMIWGALEALFEFGDWFNQWNNQFSQYFIVNWE